MQYREKYKQDNNVHDWNKNKNINAKTKMIKQLTDDKRKNIRDNEENSRKYAMKVPKNC